MRAFGFAIGLAAAIAGGAASAQETGATDPCAAFAWPLAREQTWFSAPGLRRVAPGDTLSSDAPAAVLGLKRSDDAHLPFPPSRALKPDTFAGSLKLPAPAAPGLYQITLSDEGWVDVFQEGGEPEKSVAHTGKKGCTGLRKSLRFRIEAKPFVVEVSNATSDTVRIAIAPVEEGK